MKPRFNYWRRIVSAYILPGGNLSFWHERPAIQPHLTHNRLGPYYMGFTDKASYPGPFDAEGIPLLDYRGQIGRQYNPIAISQYGLAHYNRFLGHKQLESREKFLRQANWLVENLESNPHGLKVWMHHFNFEYRQTLRAPWYSGLAQGQGISLLARAFAETKDQRYRAAMRQAFQVFLLPVGYGGVLQRETDGSAWIEEYIVDPTTHILNGFIWALWGVKDYYLTEEDPEAEQLFAACISTLERQLHRYDTGRWSLYELSNTALPMLASPFYHRLHIVQLRILRDMTDKEIFGRMADRWEWYASQQWNRTVSFVQKCSFKLLYY